VARFEFHHAKEQAQKLGPHVEKLVAVNAFVAGADV
jgi:hypothetical protein